ncbi:hypothetical protein PFLG_02592 [Plasmodium falciparum RAJ116]|uniref:Uncharacterized protein n=1 Tax=Plasmodium falciparum RAJ116 TaxID=580058 RepID=A0A0L0D1E5_PLAFA|nr:hypothetical protein PFLG_02592 [Plasmodium falciparum RAJ116]
MLNNILSIDLSKDINIEIGLCVHRIIYCLLYIFNFISLSHINILYNNYFYLKYFLFDAYIEYNLEYIYKLYYFIVNYFYLLQYMNKNNFSVYIPLSPTFDFLKYFKEINKCKQNHYDNGRDTHKLNMIEHMNQEKKEEGGQMIGTTYLSSNCRHKSFFSSPCESCKLCESCESYKLCKLCTSCYYNFFNFNERKEEIHNHLHTSNTFLKREETKYICLISPNIKNDINIIRGEICESKKKNKNNIYVKFDTNYNIQTEKGKKKKKNLHDNKKGSKGIRDNKKGNKGIRDNKKGNKRIRDNKKGNRRIRDNNIDNNNNIDDNMIDMDTSNHFTKNNNHINSNNKDDHINNMKNYIDVQFCDFSAISENVLLLLKFSLFNIFNLYEKYKINIHFPKDFIIKMKSRQCNDFTFNSCLSSFVSYPDDILLYCLLPHKNYKNMILFSKKNFLNKYTNKLKKINMDHISKVNLFLKTNKAEDPQHNQEDHQNENKTINHTDNIMITSQNNHMTNSNNIKKVSIINIGKLTLYHILKNINQNNKILWLCGSLEKNIKENYKNSIHIFQYIYNIQHDKKNFHSTLYCNIIHVNNFIILNKQIYWLYYSQLSKNIYIPFIYKTYKILLQIFDRKCSQRDILSYII